MLPKRRGLHTLCGKLPYVAGAVGSIGSIAWGQSVLISNPSFESNNPGGAGVIAGWTSSDTSHSGIITPAQAVDGTQAAFITNTNGQTATLSQFISGLDTSSVYAFCFAGHLPASGNSLTF